MARLFDDASSQYLQNSSAELTAAPFTFSGWFYPNDAGVSQAIFSLGDTAGDSNFFWMVMVATTNVLRGQSVTGAGAGNADTSNSATINAWNHGCYIEASATSRTTYLNGNTGSKGTNTDSRTPSGIDATAIGRLVRATPGVYMSGAIAECGLWNVALAEADVVALSKGFSPLMIRPQNLVNYWAIWGNDSPEKDLIGGLSMSVTGATKSAHHRIIYPSRPWVSHKAAAAAAATIPHRLMLMGVS